MRKACEVGQKSGMTGHVAVISVANAFFESETVSGILDPPSSLGLARLSFDVHAHGGQTVCRYHQ